MVKPLPQRPVENTSAGSACPYSCTLPIPKGRFLAAWASRHELRFGLFSCPAHGWTHNAPGWTASEAAVNADFVAGGR